MHLLHLGHSRSYQLHRAGMGWWGVDPDQDLRSLTVALSSRIKVILSVAVCSSPRYEFQET